MNNPTNYPDKANVTLTDNIKRALQWTNNPSTSQKMPKYAQEGMDELKKQVMSGDE